MKCEFFDNGVFKITELSGLSHKRKILVLRGGELIRIFKDRLS